MVREPVNECQRLPVSVIRNNTGMPRPKDMPDNLNTVGSRVRWWREHRKISRERLAKAAKMAPTTLADLENDRQGGSRKLHLLAAELGLNAHYLESGKGEPESEYAQEAPQEAAWPFTDISQMDIDRLDMNMIERKYAESKLLEALAEIKAERRKSKKAG